MPSDYRREHPVIAGFDRLISTVSRSAAAVAALLLVYIFLHIIVEIVMRSFFDRSTYVLDEFVGYAVAAMTFLAAGHALNNGHLIRVDLLIGRLQRPGRRVAEFFSLAVSIGMAGFCAWWVGRDALRHLTRGSVSESIAEVPLWIPVGAVWLGLVFLMLQLLACLLRVAAGGDPIESSASE